MGVFGQALMGNGYYGPMAIIGGMIVRVGNERYIIPTTAIRQLLRPVEESYNIIIGRDETIKMVGNLLQLIRLDKFFGIEEADYKSPWEAIVVVVEDENSARCLPVDEILGEEEVGIKSLGESLKNSRGVSGGAILQSCCALETLHMLDMP